jgi:hypothetical protein
LALTDTHGETDQVLKIPLMVAQSLVAPGLTASSLRMLIVLIALGGRDGQVRIDKPRFERLLGIRLDNAAVAMAPLERATIEMAEDPGNNVAGPALSSLSYTPGVQKRLSGIIEAQTNDWSIGALVGMSRNQLVEIPADEFRNYRSVSGILMRLRIAAAFSSPDAKVASWRLDHTGLANMFGSHASAAALTRTSAKTGTKTEILSLARAGQVIVIPAAEELKRYCRDVSVTAHVMLGGNEGDAKRPWLAIDVKATKRKRVSLADLAKKGAYRASLGR